MNGIAIFENSAFGNVRVIMRDGEPWFVAKDVCEILELGNPRSSVALLDDDEKGVHTMDTLGGPQAMVIISESGLYALIFRSRKPEAKAFSRWVRQEILPSIRKTGAYGLAAGSGVQELGKTISGITERLDAVEARNLVLEERHDRLMDKIEGDFHFVQKGRVFERDPHCMDINQTAHFIRQRFGIQIGGNRLFKILRGEGYVHKNKNKQYTPTQKGLANGLREEWRKYRKGFAYCTTIVTRRGLTNILGILAKQNMQRGFPGVILTGMISL